MSPALHGLVVLVVCFGFLAAFIAFMAGFGGEVDRRWSDKLRRRSSELIEFAGLRLLSYLLSRAARGMSRRPLLLAIFWGGLAVGSAGLVWLHYGA